jgi:hypothetical protein
MGKTWEIGAAPWFGPFIKLEKYCGAPHPKTGPAKTGVFWLLGPHPKTGPAKTAILNGTVFRDEVPMTVSIVSNPSKTFRSPNEGSKPGRPEAPDRLDPSPSDASINGDDQYQHNSPAHLL